MARPGYHRLNVEYRREDLRALTLYCSAGVGGITPTAIMRMLLTEFLSQVSNEMLQGANLQTVNAVVPLAVELVRAKLERGPSVPSTSGTGAPQ